MVYTNPSVDYRCRMFEVVKTETFDNWFRRLRDLQAKARIGARITQMQTGNLGDVKPIGDGVSEARIFHGPGYRLYFIQEGRAIIVLLSGGDKGSQQRDIERAKALAAEWRDQ